MKNAQTATTERDALVDYIMNLHPTQVGKIVKRMSLLKLLAVMTENELLYAETFLGLICGGKGERMNIDRGEMA